MSLVGAKKRLRELVAECYTEWEWKRRFMLLTPEMQWKIRTALEPKEAQISDPEGNSLTVLVQKFGALASEVKSSASPPPPSQAIIEVVPEAPDPPEPAAIAAAAFSSRLPN